MTTLPETNSSPLKIDPWKKKILLETTMFKLSYVSFRESKSVSDLPTWKKSISNLRHFVVRVEGFQVQLLLHPNLTNRCAPVPGTEKTSRKIAQGNYTLEDERLVHQQIIHEKKGKWSETKPPWLCYMLNFRGVTAKAPENQWLEDEFRYSLFSGANC